MADSPLAGITVEMGQPIKNKEYLEKASELTAHIRQNLPDRIHPGTVSLEAKIPFKALSLRELLLHRFADLADVACNLYSSDRLVPAIIITRSLLETLAVLYVLSKKIKTAMQEGSLESLDDELMKMLLGGRTDMVNIKAFNIQTAIDHVDKWVEGFRWSYDELCEFTHPNWSGCLGFYGEINEGNLYLKLGRNPRDKEYPFTIGINSLVTALEMFIHLYNELGDILPDFSRLCEDLLDKS